MYVEKIMKDDMSELERKYSCCNYVETLPYIWHVDVLSACGQLLIAELMH